jgi:hypothetical protein
MRLSPLSQNAFFSRASSTPTDDSSIAEPSTTSVQFPAVNSQQRAKTSVPSFEFSDSTQSRDDDDADTTREEEEEIPNLPSISIDAAPPSLAPPTTTVNVLKAPKGKVRVEKGFSQLDWARLNRKGEVDLRVSSLCSSRTKKSKSQRCRDGM